MVRSSTWRHCTLVVEVSRAAQADHQTTHAMWASTTLEPRPSTRRIRIRDTAIPDTRDRALDRAHSPASEAEAIDLIHQLGARVLRPSGGAVRAEGWAALAAAADGLSGRDILDACKAAERRWVYERHFRGGGRGPR